MRWNVKRTLNKYYEMCRWDDFVKKWRYICRTDHKDQGSNQCLRGIRCNNKFAAKRPQLSEHLKNRFKYQQISTNINPLQFTMDNIYIWGTDLNRKIKIVKGQRGDNAEAINNQCLRGIRCNNKFAAKRPQLSEQLKNRFKYQLIQSCSRIVKGQRGGQHRSVQLQQRQTKCINA